MRRAVAIGGGTGQPNVLACLLEMGCDTTAIVTVADDGGSSGALRRELGMLPLGDARNCLQKLLKLIGEERDLSRYHARVAPWWGRIEEWNREHPIAYEQPADGDLLPQFVIDKIFQMTGGRAVITTDVGQHQMWAAQYYHCQEPNHWISSGGLGTMGFGLPAAIGAQCGMPDRLVDQPIPVLWQKVDPVLGSALIFLLPCVVLAMLSPYLIRVATPSLAQVGRSSGFTIAASTIGTIAGVFVSGFVLIDHLRISTIFRLMGGLTVLLALLCLGFWHRRRQRIWLILSGSALALSMLTKLFTGFLVPIFLIGLMLTEWNRDKKAGIRWALLRPALIWSLSFASIGLLLGWLWVGPQNLAELITPHLAAGADEVFQDQKFVLETDMKSTLPLLLLGLLGVVQAILNQRWLALYPAAWAGSVPLQLHGRNPGGRATSHHVDGDARCLGADGKPDVLEHQAHAGTRRRGQRLHPAPGGPDDGGHGRDLVLHLQEGAADGRKALGQPLRHLGARRQPDVGEHRIRRRYRDAVRHRQRDAGRPDHGHPDRGAARGRDPGPARLPRRLPDHRPRPVVRAGMLRLHRGGL